MTSMKWGFALLVGLALAVAPALAEGKLDLLKKFESGSLELGVATYTDPSAPAGKGRVGLISWRSGEVRNAFAYRIDQWSAIFDLWKKAARQQGAKWATIGSVSETGTTDISRITVKAGPGIELAVTSPQGATIAYVLPAADFSDFETAMQNQRTYLLRKQ